MATLTNTNYFSPTQIAGCSLWLDAADSASVVTSGSSVTQWNDKSGNARHMSNSASYQSPIYNTTGFIGRPTISFFRNSSTSFSMLENRAFSFVSNSYTLFLIIQRNGSDTSYQHFFSAAVTPDSNPVTNTASFAITTLTNSSITMERNGAEFNTALDTTIPFLGEIIVNGTGSAIGRYNSLTTYSYVNGNSRNSSTGFSAGITLTLGHVRLGAPTSASSTNGGSIFQGNMSEVLYFNRALTTIESQQIEGYLAWKWALQANLPTTHPYFYNPMIPNLILPAPLANPLTTTNTTLITMNPTQIAGCALWLDAADDNSVSRTGSNVTAWNDKSGTRNNFTTVAGTPTYTSASEGVFFNGANAACMQSSSAISYTSGVTSLFIVTKVTASGFNYIVTFGNGADYSLRYNGAIGTDGNDAIIYGNIWYLNGNSQSAGSPLPVTIFNATSLINGVVNRTQSTVIQVSTTFGGRYLTGFIQEVIMYNTTLTTTQRQQIEGYLAWKWGLQASLQITHPYYYNPLVPNLILPSQLLSMTPSFLNPSRFTGLSLWLDAADTNTITQSGGSVTRWNDKSGNGRNATTVNSIQYIIDSQNRNAIYINNSQSFNIPSFAPSATSQISVFCVINQLQTVGAGNVDMIRTSSYANFTMNLAISTNNYNLFLNNASVTSATTFSVNNRVTICEIVFNVSSGNTFVNGSTTTTFSAAAGTALTTSQTLVIGGNTTINMNYYELLFYSTTLTTTQRQQIEGYLAWKWGLQSNLPANHPYVLFPPS